MNITANNSAYGIQIGSSSDNNTIVNGTIGNINGSWSCGIYVTGSSYTRITSTMIDNVAGDGLYLTYAIGSTIDSTHICNNTDEGIYMYQSTMNSVSSCSIYGNSGEGVFLWDAPNNTVTANHVYGNTGSGIYLRRSGSINNSVLSNHVYDNEGNGIYIYQLAHYNTVDSNQAYNNSGHGIYISGSDHAVVENCNCSFNRGSGISLYYADNNEIHNNSAACNDDSEGYYNVGSGIFLYESRYNDIYHNTVTNNDAIGIYLYRICHENTIYTNTVSGNDEHGISLYGGSNPAVWCNNNLLYGNTVACNRFNGINIGYTSGGGSNITFINNTVYENGEHGIYFGGGSSHNTIQACTMHDNTLDGIHIYNGEHDSIAHNHVYANIRYGINLFSCTDETASNNTAQGHTNRSYSAGIVADSTTTSMIRDNALYNNSRGLYIWSSAICAKDNHIYMNRDGIYLANVACNSTITANVVENNTGYGIFIADSTSNGNYIYDNYFNNTNNARDTGINHWNISKTPGFNVIGGAYLGGNFWHDYAGADATGDGLGDTMLPYNASGAIGTGGDHLPLTTRTLPPDCSILRGYVNGSMIENAYIVVYNESYGWSNHTYTDENGSYSLRLFAGHFLVSIEKNGYASYHADVFVPQNTTVWYNVTLELADNSRIKGFVKDGYGNPVDNATVMVFIPDEYMNGTFVGPDGSYEINVFAGAFFVLAGKDGYDTNLTRVSIGDNETMWHNITLYRTDAWVEGYIVDEMDAPIENVTVTLHDRYRFFDGNTAVTDENGYYNISFHGGRYIFIAQHGDEGPFEMGRYDPVVFEVEIPSNQSVNISRRLMTAPEPTPLMAHAVLVDWNHVNNSMQMVMGTINQSKIMRLFIDYYVGDGDYYLNQTEYEVFMNTMMDGNGGGDDEGMFQNDTRDMFTVDGIYYILESNMTTIEHLTGWWNISEIVAMHAWGTYITHETISPTASHTAVINATYADNEDYMDVQIVFPSGYGMTSYDAVNVTVSGVTTVTITPGGDPDTGDNTTWERVEIVVEDIASPVISNVMHTPDTQTSGKEVNISCQVIDGVAVHTVKVNITHPDGSTANHTMLGGSYYYAETYTQAGEYTYFIWANDTNGNANISSAGTFSIAVPQYSLTTSVSPSGSGSVTLNPSPEPYATGTTVTATAQANTGYQFSHWTGDAGGTSQSVQVVMNADRSITAHFTSTMPPTPDNEPPSVSITSPTADDTVASVVTVQGTSSDSDGTVQAVEIQIDDGAWQDAAGMTSWSYSWDTTGVANGNHTIRARSYDGEDYSSAASITVTVFNNHPPAITITSPADGAIVNGTILVNGTMSDPDGNGTIQDAQIKIGDGNWTSISFNLTAAWSHRVNTTTYENGDYTIQARVYDGTDYSSIAALTISIHNEEEAGDGTPGFELLAVIAALCASFVLVTRRKR